MLVELHREIEARTREIASSHPDWPCRRGCDTCCRRLADVPRLTREEWELLEEGLRRLDELTLIGIRERIQALKSQERPFTCPFLDREAGSCLVYEHRPIACRTYGFYVERDKGLYCRMIEERVDSGEFGEVVWGNGTAVDSRLGEKTNLPEWFSDSPEWLPRPLPIRT